ncbi:MAG: OmpA family protein [Gammaproteobacteria bacterium]|jgi:outer membrane protein OmpA-like peptidoglycan-associated protein|nr:OmpA family protein [Gammaproteobacteria bacterium]
MHIWIRSACPILVLAILSGPACGQDIAAAEAAQQQALDAGADTLAPEAYNQALERLEQARESARRGKDRQAAERGQRAAAAFRAAQLSAVQEAVLGAARAAYREADAARARRFAPATMAQARELLDAGAELLARDRTAVAAAAELASEAAAMARLAAEITAVARTKPTIEDLLRQQAADLERLQAAAGLQQSINRDLVVAVGLLEDEIARLRDAEQQLTLELADSRAFSAALEEEIRLLDDRLGGATAERRKLVLQLEAQAREREQLAQVKSLFAAAEAEVFEQSGAIIVRLVGARFASGSAELETASLPLLDKAADALAIYPNASVVVEGHTDSKGGDRLNQRLSQNRAETVVNELLARSAIAPGQISAVGYGESRPVANNETEAGRAVNRRIDLVISPAAAANAIY